VLEFFFKLLLLACAWKWKYFIIANIKSDPFQCGMEDDEDVFLIRKKMGVCGNQHLNPGYSCIDFHFQSCKRTVIRGVRILEGILPKF